MFDKIKEILVNTANVDENKINEDALLREDLGIDSLDSVEVVLEIESEFDIRIEDDELKSMQTVKDIIDLVNSKKE